MESCIWDREGKKVGNGHEIIKILLSANSRFPLAANLSPLHRPVDSALHDIFHGWVAAGKVSTQSTLLISFLADSRRR